MTVPHPWGGTSSCVTLTRAEGRGLYVSADGDGPTKVLDALAHECRTE